MATTEIKDRIIEKANQAGIDYTTFPGPSGNVESSNYIANVAAHLGMDPNRYNVHDIENALDEMLGIDNNQENNYIPSSEDEGYSQDVSSVKDSTIQKSDFGEVDSSTNPNKNTRFSNNNIDKQSNNIDSNRTFKKNQYQDNISKNAAKAAEEAGSSALDSVKDAAKDEVADKIKDVAKDKVKDGAAEAAKNVAAKAATDAATKEVAKKAAASTILKNPYFWVILALILVFIALILFVVIFADYLNVKEKYGSGEFPYVKMDFSETVVLNTDGGSYSMPLDDYVACVLNGEVGETTLSDDHLKAFAIAIRSNVLNKGGVVGSGTNFQVAKCESGVTDPGSHLHNIADETTGIVLVDGTDNNVKFHYSFYDELAFNESCGGSEKDGIITICQKGVQIPRDWLTSHGLTDARIDYLQNSSYHGQGMSQYGSYYLALEKGYDYKQILSYFYDDATIISLYPPAPVGNVTLEIIETPSEATELSEPLETFFIEHGTTIQKVNDGLLEAVMKAGPGTRAGVVTAALYTVNILLDYDTRLPYYWGGGIGDATGDSAVSETYGFYPYWGTYNPRYGGTNGDILYEHTGIDCGRYVTWIFLNGGVTIYSEDDEFGPNYGSGQFLYKAHTTRHDVADLSEYIGQPGDVLVSSSGGHAILILAYDSNSEGYYVAQASGADSDIKVNYASVSYLKSYGNYDVVDMSWYYENQAIKNFDQVFNENRKDK